MAISLSSPWHDLTFMSALSDERADRLVRFIAGGAPSTIFDLGCGWAELLLRAVAAAPASTGVGVDLDEAALQHGRDLAAARGLSDRVELRTDGSPETADAVICVGATHAWAPPAGPGEPLHYRAALDRIRAVLPRGGRLAYGEGVWSQPPTPAAAAALGGSDDELVTLSELVSIAADAGFAAQAVHEATLDEWDSFESGYTACYTRWLSEHRSDDPDAAEVRRRQQEQQERYLGGYRGILGLAYLELIAI